MQRSMTHALGAALSIGLLSAMPAVAEPITFSTAAPDGRIGTLWRPASSAGIQKLA